MKKIFTTLVLALLCSCSEQVVLDNGALRLVFDRASGNLVSMQNVERDYEYLDTEAEQLPLYEFVAMNEGDTLVQPEGVQVCRTGLRSAKIVWGTEGDLKITAKVCLNKKKPMSYWSVEISGYDGERTKMLRFPRISNIKAFDDEKLALSTWTGVLYHNPRATHKVINKEITMMRPTMQFSTIYSAEDEFGLYFGSNDTQSYTKGLKYEFSDNVTHYNATYHLPMGAEQSHFVAPYEVVVGTLEGDWFDASQIYREWALQQEWTKNSRLASGKINPWMPATDVWLWNRGRSNNVLTEAADLKEYLGDCNVSVLWHWWHNGPYDDAFPEFLPPREGEESFKKAVAEARAKGINMTPYMNSIQWGESRKSWKELNIPQYSARKADGSTYAHTYNIFTKNPITPMCMSQEFWYDTYSALCHTVVNEYGCSGVYMDQANLDLLCYNPNHGHSVGGGNYWVDGYRRLVERVREATAPENPILTGEGTGEDLLCYHDGFLALEPSIERAVGVKQSEAIPLFTAVYHEYAISYGNFGGFTYPAYDEFWPKKYRSPLTETLLPAIYDIQMRLEQTRTFVWGIQPMLVNYHSEVRSKRGELLQFCAHLIKTRKAYKEYLQYGTMLRAPKFEDDATREIDMCRTSTYGAALGTGQILFPMKAVVPMLYSAAWKNSEGNVLLTFVNIDEKAHSTTFAIDIEEMGLSEEYRLYVDGVVQEGAPQSKYEIEVPACSTIIYEFRK